MPGANELTALEAARRLDAGELTAETLLADCLARIEVREPTVGAWAHLDAAAALRRARVLDRAASRGPLHGLPIGVKDIFDTVAMPTGYGSAAYAGNRPAWDAACVALARAAGAIVLGKTVTTEFANFAPGRTANPRHPSHTPGGSSSGSAAAVADGMAMLALGTQTAGSVIRPAAFCGIVGFKPSFGVLPRAGVKPLADSLDTIGVFARTVADAALFMAAMTGREALRADEAIAEAPRVGLCRTPQWQAAEPPAVAALEEAGRRLSAAGATVSEVVLPDEYAGLADAQRTVQLYETARSLAFERLAHDEWLSESLRALLADGEAVTHADYAGALALGERCRRQMPDVMGELGIEALIAPAACGEAPRGLESTGDPLFSRMWTLLHGPCVHVPVLTGPGGLPVGAQVVGAAGDDARILGAARWLEKALGAG